MSYIKFSLFGLDHQKLSDLFIEKENDKGEVERKWLKIDDIYILNQLADYIYFPNAKTAMVDGIQYSWVSYSSLLESLPLLRIEKRTLVLKIDKLVEFGLVEKVVQKDEGGTMTLFRMTQLYSELKYVPHKILEGGAKKFAPGVRKNSQPYTDINKNNLKEEPIVRKNSFSPYSQENEKSEENIAAEPPAPASKYMAIAVEFLNSPSILTAFCKNNKVTYEQCEAIVDEIVTEWEFAQPAHTTETEAKFQLLRTLETKIRIKREHGLLDNNSRKEQFIADCKALKEEGYNKQDIARFYNYYIQPAQDGSDKCLFETYKAWNTKTRFKMFLKPPKK